MGKLGRKQDPTGSRTDRKLVIDVSQLRELVRELSGSALVKR